LKRWSIREDRLPPDSIVKFKEFTVWEKHKGRIIGAITLIFFQTLIILFLMYHRGKPAVSVLVKYKVDELSI
ncbi:MAG: hypothetical protein PVG67_09130, partial [Desulfobacterales bacterium]